MSKTLLKIFKKAMRVGVVLVVAFSSARTVKPTPDDSPKTSAATVDDYKIGPSDVLTISVPDAPEFGGKFRVSDSGVIEVPGVPAAIHAEGQTTIELAHSIRESLMDAKQLRDPRVSVFVEEYH